MKKKIKYLHIIPPNDEESFPIVDFFNKHFDTRDHCFFALMPWEGAPAVKLKKIKNVILFIQGKTRVERIFNLYKLLDQAQFIIWHGLNIAPKHLIFIHMFNKIAKKSIWVSRGVDLFGWARDTSKLKGIPKLVNRFLNDCDNRFRKLTPYFVAHFPPDSNRYLSTFNPHGTVFNIPYSWEDVFNIIEKSKYKKVKDGCTRILVGHNAYPWNNHIAILDNLAKYRYENIKIYIPLGYGSSKKYKDMVCDYANKLFGHKAVCIRKKQTTDKYLKLITNIDVFILHKMHPSVQVRSIHIILMILYMNKKVYFPAKSRMYNYFTNLGYKIFDSSLIPETDFEKFKERTSIVKQQQSIRFTINDMKDCWEHIFETIDENAKIIEFAGNDNGKQKIKYLHIIRPSETLSYSIIKIISDNFDKTEHRFLINRRVPIHTCGKLRDFDTVDFFLKGNTKFKQIRYFYNRLKYADHIIWHGLYIGYGKPILEAKELFFLSLFKGFLKKMTWVPWGMDLYEWKTDTSKLRGFKLIATLICNYFGKMVRQNIASLVTIFPPDADGYTRQFKNHIPIYDGSYSAPDFIDAIEMSRPKEKKSKHINILLGHNANEWNYHFKALDNLAKFRYENIRIYIPLSFGPVRSYATRVKEYAKKMFGNKAICIYKEMNLQNYIKFLWSIDIVYFLIDRQGALGNLMRLIYMGKKIYLPQNTLMYDFFRSQGIEISDATIVPGMDFSEFICPISNQEPPKYILDRTEPNKVVQKWKYIFNEISKKETRY